MPNCEQSICSGSLFCICRALPLLAMARVTGLSGSVAGARVGMAGAMLSVAGDGRGAAGASMGAAGASMGAAGASMGAAGASMGAAGARRPAEGAALEAMRQHSHSSCRLASTPKAFLLSSVLSTGYHLGFMRPCLCSAMSGGLLLSCFRLRGAASGLPARALAAAGDICVLGGDTMCQRTRVSWWPAGWPGSVASHWCHLQRTD